MRGLACAALVAGCTTADISADQAELDNIRPWNLIPRTSPALYVATFDRYCINAPGGLPARDAQLRAAGYVPLRKRRDLDSRAYVADDTRPAVSITATSCMVRAMARTGQADRVRRYMADRFPDAGYLPESPIRTNVEEFWLLTGETSGTVATQRHVDGSVHIYDLIYSEGTS